MENYQTTCLREEVLEQLPKLVVVQVEHGRVDSDFQPIEVDRQVVPEFVRLRLFQKNLDECAREVAENLLDDLLVSCDLQGLVRVVDRFIQFVLVNELHFVVDYPLRAFRAVMPSFSEEFPTDSGWRMSAKLLVLVSHDVLG